MDDIKEEGGRLVAMTSLIDPIDIVRLGSLLALFKSQGINSHR